jgi:hypothetical protein
MISLLEKSQGRGKISEPKKPKFIPGFKPGLLGHKPIALLFRLNHGKSIVFVGLLFMK